MSEIKRIIIGDVHGRWDVIEKIYNKEQPNEVIILGDYFDSYDVSSKNQLECYKNIRALREQHIKTYGRGFHLLVGNHDIHYIFPYGFRCNGFNTDIEYDACQLLSDDFDNERLKFVYIDRYNHTIYSHAGVSREWWEQWVSSDLSMINNTEISAFRYTFKDGGDFNGSSPYNSPIFIRPCGLNNHEYYEVTPQGNKQYWNQVFGHTEVKAPMWWNIEDATLYDIDCIGIGYYMVEIIDLNSFLITNRYFSCIN